MLKLTYTRRSNVFQTVTVIGDPEGIRDLYWQLTQNHNAHDGTAICDVEVTNLDGINCTGKILTEPYANMTQMSLLRS